MEEQIHFSIPKSKLKKIILAVVVFFVVEIGAYQLGVQSISNPQNPTQPTISIIPTQTNQFSAVTCSNGQMKICNYCECTCVSDPYNCQLLSQTSCEKNTNCYVYKQSGTCECPKCRSLYVECRPKETGSPAEATPTVTQQIQHPSQQELFNLAKTRKVEILANSGTVATDLKFTDLEQFGENVYLISFAYLDSKGNQIPTGGGWALVGLVYNKWTVSIGHEPQYCTWLKNSDKDAATKAFMGIERC